LSTAGKITIDRDEMYEHLFSKFNRQPGGHDESTRDT
jgi:hypothetical protein